MEQKWDRIQYNIVKFMISQWSMIKTAVLMLFPIYMPGTGGQNENSVWYEFMQQL